MKSLLLVFLPTLLLAQSPSDKIYDLLIDEASFSLATSDSNNKIFGVPLNFHIEVKQGSDSLNHKHERSYEADDIEIRAMRFENSDKHSFFFYNKLLSFFENSDYTVSKPEEGEDTKIYIQKAKGNVSELHLIFKGENEGSILSFYGNIKVSELCEITDSFEEGTCKHLGNIQ